MTIKIFLSEEQLQQLSILRDLKDEDLNNIVKELKEIKPTPLKPSDLSKIIVKYSPNNVDVIVRLLLSLYNIRRQGDLTSLELLDALIDGIDSAEPTWADDEKEKWKNRQPLYKELFALESISTVVKGLDLSYDYTNLLQKIKILTDIRPIFNEDASVILGSIISHTLRISYDTREGHKNLSLAIDTEDINNLLQSCERAIKKAKTAKYFMEKSGNLRTFICGEEK